MASRRDEPGEAGTPGREPLFAESEVGVVTASEEPRRPAPASDAEAWTIQKSRREREGGSWLGHDDPSHGQTRLPDMGLRHYLRLVLRYRRLILAVLCSTMVLTVARILLRPRIYMAKATILPSGGQNHGGFMGLIASLTGAPPAGALSEEVTSLLFPSILESRSVGLEVLEATYRFQKDDQLIERTLAEHLGAENIDKALKTLHRMASFDVNKETGTITVAVATLYPELSAQVANRFVDSLERLSLEMRRTAAFENRSFVQERLEKSLEELTLAEQKLTEFREQNIRMNAPELDLEYLRLQRDVTLKSQIYVSLSNQAELARIEAAKEMPLVRILDRAAIPKAPLPVPKVTSLALGLIVGVLSAVLIVAGVEILHYLRREIALCKASFAEGAEA